MTNAELIAKIKAEIERLKVDYLNRSYTFVPVAMEHLLDFLSSLESEKPMQEDLEKELNKWRHNHFNGERDGHFSGEYLTRGSQLGIARHFAEWQKEQMMKEAVEVQVVGEQRDLRLIDSTQRCLFDAKRGDWLKIIIVKED